MLKAQEKYFKKILKQYRDALKIFLDDPNTRFRDNIVQLIKTLRYRIGDKVDKETGEIVVKMSPANASSNSLTSQILQQQVEQREREEEKERQRKEREEREREEKKRKIASAQDKEEHLDYDGAIAVYEEIGDKTSAKRVRKLKAEKGAVKVDQTVVHGDYIDDRDTIVKDSVISKSNVGAGGDGKFAQLKELKEMLTEGLIDEDEFKQMKKEILGTEKAE